MGHAPYIEPIRDQDTGTSLIFPSSPSMAYFQARISCYSTQRRLARGNVRVPWYWTVCLSAIRGNTAVGPRSLAEVSGSAGTSKIITPLHASYPPLSLFVIIVPNFVVAHNPAFPTLGSTIPPRSPPLEMHATNALPLPLCFGRPTCRPDGSFVALCFWHAKDKSREALWVTLPTCIGEDGC